MLFNNLPERGFAHESALEIYPGLFNILPLQVITAMHIDTVKASGVTSVNPSSQ
jgi:hypothetical protein